MSAWTYEAKWKIADPGRDLEALSAEACGRLDFMAAADGARVVGDVIDWQVCGERLIARTPARPLNPADGPDPREYIDEIAVERAVRGDNVRLTRAERRVAVERLVGRGYTVAQVARALAMSYTLARAHVDRAVRKRVDGCG